MPVDSDRNLLFGMLALQMDFISRIALIEGMQAWLLDKSRTLGEILVERGALVAANRALLEPLVEANIKLHGGDARRSLAALSSDAGLGSDLQRIDDVEIRASIAALPKQSLFHAGAVSSAVPIHDWESPSESAKVDPYKTEYESIEPQLRYQVLRRHAEGGLGRIYVAIDRELNREVAFKEIRQDRMSKEACNRFKIEAEITGGLEHPGIVPVYGLGHYPDGRPFYAMRFIRGDSLLEAVVQFHRKNDSGRSMATSTKDFASSLPFRDMVKRLIDVCNAIQYAHDRGVLHRDLKPDNIMLGRYGETLVVDWGLAKAGTEQPKSGSNTSERPFVPLSGSQIDETRYGQAMGTYGFMSPEQSEGKLDLLGPTSDVYSLGATLYAILTGEPPLRRFGLAELLTRLRKGDIPPPRIIQSNAPRALEAICQKSMALEPCDRYPSAKAMTNDLNAWLADQPVSAYREPMMVRTRRWLRHHPVALSTSAVAVVLTLFGLTLFSSLLAGKNAELSKLNFDLDSTNMMLSDLNVRERDVSEQLNLRQKELKTKNLDLQLRNGYLACENQSVDIGLATMCQVLREAFESDNSSIEHRVRRLIEGWSSEEYFNFPIARTQLKQGQRPVEFLEVFRSEFSPDGKWLADLADPDDTAPPDAAKLSLYRMEKVEGGLSGIELRSKIERMIKLGSNFTFAPDSQCLAYVNNFKIVITDLSELTDKTYQLPEELCIANPNDLPIYRIGFCTNRDRLVIACPMGYSELDTSSGEWKQVVAGDKNWKAAEMFALTKEEPLRIAFAGVSGIYVVDTTFPIKAVRMPENFQSFLCSSLDFNQAGTLLCAAGASDGNPRRPTERGCFQTWRLIEVAENDVIPHWERQSRDNRTCLGDMPCIRLMPHQNALILVSTANVVHSSPSILQLESLDANALTRSVNSLDVSDVVNAIGVGSAKHGVFATIDIMNEDVSTVWRVAVRNRLLAEVEISDQINCACFAEPKNNLYVGTSKNGLMRYSFDGNEVKGLAFPEQTAKRMNGEVTAICCDKQKRRVFWTGRLAGEYDCSKEVANFRSDLSNFWLSEAKNSAIVFIDQAQSIAVLAEARVGGLFFGLGSESRSLIDFREPNSRRKTIVKDNVIFRSFAVGPNNIMIVAGSDRKLHSWDLLSMKEKDSSDTFASPIDLVLSTPDSSVYAVITSDGAAFINRWKPKENQKYVLQHNSRVSSACLSADGSLLAIGCEDGRAHIWDTSTGERIGPALKHTQPISATAFSPDSTILFTGAGDVGRFWSVPNGTHEPTGTLINRIEYITGTVCGKNGEIRNLSTLDRLDRLNRDDAALRELRIWPEFPSDAK